MASLGPTIGLPRVERRATGGTLLALFIAAVLIGLIGLCTIQGVKIATVNKKRPPMPQNEPAPSSEETPVERSGKPHD